MNTDTLQLIGQIILIGLGPLLAKHGITLGNADVDQVVGAVAFVAGILWKFRHWNATPAATPAAVPIRTGTVPPTTVGIILLSSMLSVSALVIQGCAGIAPGADPIVVNVERTETIAQDTFAQVLAIDNSQRAFYASNAPAFHGFCEWLRQPQTVEVTNTLPRASALLVSLDDVKVAYKSARASSNDLYTALQTVTSAMSQAQSWLNTGMTKPTP